MAEISNNDLFLAINELAKSVNEIKIVADKTEERVGNLENEILEVKGDVKKVDKKVSRLAAELLDAS